MLEKLAQKYAYENGVFTEVGKRGPKVSLSSKDMLKILMDYYPYEELHARLHELTELIKAKKQDVWDATIEQVARVREILNAQDFVKDFRLLLIDGVKYIYHFEDNRVTLVQAGYPSTSDWVSILLEYKNEEMVDLQMLLAPILYPKSPFSVTLESVTQLVANSLGFSKRKDLHETLLTDIKPVTLSTSDEISFYKIPYEHVETPVLNPYMQEFLSRVSDSDYLCAIIWLTVNGFKSSYVVYLYGTGGEGKSSFLNVLKRQVQSAAALHKYNQFSNFSMHGKAMIVLTENTDCFLLQDKLVKQLTGNSLIACEPKNGKIFSANLPGTLYADGNKILKIKGEDFELRRLRLFKLRKPVIKDKRKDLLAMATYEAFLAEDFNSFLNHCRVCFEKVGSVSDWLVPASDTQEQDFKTLIDQGFIYTSEAVLKKILKVLNLEYFETGEFESTIFWKTFYDLPEAKEKYLYDNIRDYLFLHRKVSEVGGILYGIRQKNSDHTTFVPPTN